MRGRKPKNNFKQRKVKSQILLFLIFFPLLYVIINIIKWPFYNYLLDNHSKKTHGKIIEERNVIGKGVITKMYSYSYEFCVNKKYYKTDSKNQKYKAGDEVVVEYLESLPSINRIK